MVFSFNWISTFVVYLTPKLSLKKKNQWYYLIHSWGDKWIYTFLKNISSKVISMVRLEFELASYDIAVQHFRYIMRTPYWLLEIKTLNGDFMSKYCVLVRLVQPPIRRPVLPYLAWCRAKLNLGNIEKYKPRKIMVEIEERQEKCGRDREEMCKERRNFV